MYGGLLKTASAAAILAAAGLFGASSAKAADLGGDCCADLEERVAELEATTVRKGNRKVSLTLSGYVSHHVMHWDDGIRSDTYIGDGGNYGSRFRFLGSAKISPTLSAGFLYEFQANANAIGSLNQGNGGDDLGNTGGAVTGGCATSSNGLVTTGSPGCVVLRDSTVWLRHSQMGMVKVGHGSTSTDNLVLIDLGGMSGASTPDVGLYGGGMRIAQGNVYSGVNWSQAVLGGTESWDTSRRNHVMYETPTFAGFSVQAAWGEDNFWDVALRYAGEFGGFRLAFGIGYREDTEFNSGLPSPASASGLGSGITDVFCAANCERKEQALLGSASILHVASGIFVTGAAGRKEFDGDTATTFVPEDADFWYVAAGVRKNWFGYGDTVLFGEYSEHNNFLVATNTLATLPAAFINDSKATVWGVGVVQYIDAAAMELFLTYKNYSLDAQQGGFDVQGIKDLDLVIGGARVSF